MELKNTHAKENGFTILEVVVSISIFTILILLTAAFFSLSQKSYNTGVNGNELTQNARVSLDRISREIRQSTGIITALSATSTEIFFQNGHDITQISYMRYYLNGTDLMRAHEAYHFSADPSVYVIWNSLDAFGQPPEKLTLEDRVVGEYFNNMQFWGDNNLVHILITLTKNQKQLKIQSSVFCRN